jgi:hypothetical protein
VSSQLLVGASSNVTHASFAESSRAKILRIGVGEPPGCAIRCMAVDESASSLLKARCQEHGPSNPCCTAKLSEAPAKRGARSSHVKAARLASALIRTRYSISLRGFAATSLLAPARGLKGREFMSGGLDSEHAPGSGPAGLSSVFTVFCYSPAAMMIVGPAGRVDSDSELASDSEHAPRAGAGQVGVAGRG